MYPAKAKEGAHHAAWRMSAALALQVFQMLYEIREHGEKCFCPGRNKVDCR